MMNRIPLSIRFTRLEDGEPSDPAYVRSVIKNMADTPIVIYLCGFGDELDWLITALAIPEKQAENLTYQDIAVRIAGHTDKAFVTEAVRVLSLPFYQRFKERVVQDEKNPA